MQMRRATVQIARDSQRGILTGQPVGETLRNRAAVVNSCTGAEFRLYQDRCFKDYQKSIENALTAQLQLFKDISRELENALSLYTSV